MREVEWIEHGPLGRWRAQVSGTVADLLTGGPYPSLSPPEVPPLAIVNEILGTRGGGGGMNGGRGWRPFALSQDEYGELVNDLVTAHGFVVIDVPPWVSGREDWHVWLMDRRRGVPAGQQRDLNRHARDLAERLKDAQAEPGTAADELARVYLAAKRAEDDAAHFKDPWIMAARFTKHRRAYRWFTDAQARHQAAELAGDTVGAAAAKAEIELVRERCRTIPDDEWPSDWEDWPEYPPAEQRPPRKRD